MVRPPFSLLTLFFLFFFSHSDAQTEDLAISENTFIHIITNDFNSIDTAELYQKINATYDGIFYIWSSPEFKNRQDQFKNEDEYTLTIKINESSKDSTITTGTTRKCLLNNHQRNLNLSWEFNQKIKIEDLVSLFDGFEEIRKNKEANFDSMHEKAEDEREPIKFTTNGRPVQGLSDAIDASVTINLEDGHGSGFFIGDSIVVTNHHVIEDQDDITSYLTDDTISFEVIAADSILDLAILKSDVASEVYFSLSKDRSMSIIVGTDVLIIGSPTSKLLSNSLSSGIISGIREFDDIHIIQTDAKINPGNSGGPLLDSKGNLYGVVTAKVFGLGIEGIGFAIPTKYIIQLLN